jgi:aryl-alcohol dehydrogenase-like predicted oxidoreductase
VESSILGKTGVRVSRLGVGLAEIGALASEEQEQAGRLLNAALDAGINFLDTAECYGVSEEVLGRYVGHRRDEFILATKAGHVAGGYAGQPWTGQTVTDSIERSLVRMKTDYVDLVQLHAYDAPHPPQDEVVKAVMNAREAGKTRFVGYSQENEEAEWAVESGLFDTLQTAFSLADQRARYGLLEAARSKGIGIIAKRPIANAVWGKAVQAGYTGKLGGGTKGQAEELLARSQAILGLGNIPGMPDDPIELALGFVLSHDEVDTAIVGTRNPRHMLENIEIAKTRLPISRDVVDELHRRYDKLGGDWRSVD